MDWIDRLNGLIGRLVAWGALAMTALTLVVVVLRYVFDEGTLVLQESVLYLHGIAFMLAIPWTLKQGGHVRVDLLYGRLDERSRARIDLAGHLLLLLPLSAFIVWTSAPYVAASWRILEGSPDVGGIPGIFLLKTLIPLMATLLFLQGLAEIARAWRQARR
ncbi:MAG: TRAP transporter small permease subunit [Pseudomonadales bacterium]